MPKMNGLDMVDKIRILDSEIPIIYTTAFNDNEYMKRTIDQSIISYIIKPIDIELLLKGMEKASLRIENERLKASLLKINQELEAKIDLKTKELRDKNEILKLQLHTDELTSLSNRKSLLKDIYKTKNPILSIIDIDSFGVINDLYGEKEIKNKFVKIELLKENDLAIVKIHDNAGGIPDEIKEKVFDPYFTTKHKSQGTGIGLFMSKKIVTQHFNGNIEVKNKNIKVNNEEFNGAEFYIQIKLT